ncbi:uncharacterized protein EV420DRAFT_843673 [Desarmillaria tabescens]|uniref:Uncharacterized protein n=1 Tax=Armillaria tabescens TaxID=1929756 RepID=A0AA39JT51_ARMTA|nr:uncharacterized protein EV420DRAFT_843673 [Desarmillaria tabescens]KAK0448447.1 hypothetical protein EV420DRAFT_843673 [Desarmillaria tabescens]
MTTLRHPLRQQSQAEATPTLPSSYVPSIRLIAATPSAAGLSSEPSTSANRSLESSWASVPAADWDSPSALAPRLKEPTPRKRLVPKKSKLSMLGVGGGGIKEREKTRDFSDVVRRVGGDTASATRGFEIYVDPTEDPDIGEIVLVKKKKSRAALDGMRWGGGPMAEVTNVPSTKMKKEKEEGGKEKWWAIGRGRKDSREKGKGKERSKDSQRPNLIPRSKTPEPFKPPLQEVRTRSNSLDPGALLSAPNTFSPTYQANNFSSPQIAPQPQPRSRTSTLGGLLAPPTLPNDQNQNPRQGSIALRAMRSLARIGSWAQLRNPGNENESKKYKDVPKKKTVKKDAEKKPKKTKDHQRTSTSSFEAGALTASPEVTRTFGYNKKRSILGLGLPSSMTMKLPAGRDGSTASSTMSQAPPPVVDNNRLSVESAAVMGRPSSAMSTASSLRPMSTTSGTSRASSGSGASVKWDEAGLETVRDRRDRERGIKKGIKEEQKRRDSRESRRSSEGRKRTPLSDIFPEIGTSGDGEEARHIGEGSPAVSGKECPVVRVETATCDGHEDPGADKMLVATPVRRARPRPASEQLLGKARPRGIYEDSENGALSVLDAVTNDLANLINTLDLEATPGGTPDPSPIARRNTREPEASPTKMRAKKLRLENPSVTSLRPYAQATVRASPSQDILSGKNPEKGFVKKRASELGLGKQIAPLPVFDSLPPVKLPSSPPPPTAFVRTHKRTLTPGPLPDPSPVLRPLRPAKPRISRAVAKSPTTSAKKAARPPPSTFRSSIAGFRNSTSSQEFNELENHPIFMRKRASLGADKRASRTSTDHDDTASRRPLAPGARKMLGMRGTMGGSDVSAYAEDVDVSDPDSDIPDELQFILHGKKTSVVEAEEEEGTMDYSEAAESGKGSGMDDTMDYHHEGLSFINDRLQGLSFVDEEMEVDVPAPSPVFRAQVIDEQEHHIELEPSEEDTNKSFDFTGELQKLNESGDSDRRSFVEQLENAFRTPAKIDLRYDFAGPVKDGLLQFDVPPVPSLPPPPVPDDSLQEWTDSATGLMDVQEPTFLHGSSEQEELSKSRSSFDMYTTSQIRDMVQPTLLSMTDSLATEESGPAEGRQFLKRTSSTLHSSDGELNESFKFGGSRSSPPSSEDKEKPMTLSDIIPPPAHARSLSMGSIMADDSVLKSILAKASEVPRPRVSSDSSKRPSRAHSRQVSGSSFTGLESFDEVRRGFEFPDNRPTFYPPSAAAYSKHNRQESTMSFASVSSYGRVVNPGVVDPFDYGDCGLPSLQEMPSSESLSASMSMSMDVEDTFEFLHRRQRRRAESDASSFYFKPPDRGHRRNESNLSVSSQFPPNSRYNRSFGIGFGGGHRKNDSINSMSSVANSYAMHGANAGRAAWAKHHRSQDSAASEFSTAMHLGRPGIGDKMFDNAPPGVLTSISASPSESVKSSFDSIMDIDDPRSGVVDSLFDQTGVGSSEDESIFGRRNQYEYPRGHLAPPLFRPLSVLSMHGSSVQSPREDDTMISMLGGGRHERRVSIGSIMDIDKSPCVRVEKRKHSEFRMKGEAEEGAVKARIVVKPSIASTAESTKFGGERMIRAQHGLLDRRSLEESCLVAEGEDMSFSFGATVFTKPDPLSRSRSSTCTSNSGTSGADTPPLSASEGTSISEGSQSSIDLEEINVALTNTTHPMTGAQRSRVRARARGHGHRRRHSHTQTSRSSIYETIQEEASPMSSPGTHKSSSPTAIQSVFVVDEDTASIHSATTTWDDERGIVALRRYYELREEVESTVTESKRVWIDTPFSLFALQCFDPPRHPAGMQALLEHSVQNYGPLPSELRPKRVRSRTSSRASPYPSTRALKAAAASPELITKKEDDVYRNATSSPLGDIPHANIMTASLASKPFSPSIEELKRETAWGPAAIRPRVGSTARRTALGWAKRSNGKTPTDLKENTPKMNMTRGESLRLSRPRPKGRPTPVRQIRL